jgi:hypothetical protein
LFFHFFSPDTESSRQESSAMDFFCLVVSVFMHGASSPCCRPIETSTLAPNTSNSLQ